MFAVINIVFFSIKALVDYDSDEDEDEGEDDEDEDDACEDEDAVESEKNKIDVEDGPLSSPSIGSTVDDTKPMEVQHPVDKEALAASIKDASVNSEDVTSAHIDASVDRLTTSVKIEDLKTTDHNDQLGIVKEAAAISDSKSDTHISPEKSVQDCSPTTVQNNSVTNNQQVEPRKEIKEEVEDYSGGDGSPQSLEQKSLQASDVQSIGKVSSNGDELSVTTLSRSNDCMDDVDTGPAAKRQRLCPVEDPDSAGELNAKKEFPGASEANLPV